MKTRMLVAVAATAALVCGPGPATAAVGQGGGTPGTSKNLELVGSSPLFGRGMNAAPAIYRDWVYIGNRTDASSTCGPRDPRFAADPNSCPHPHPGILIENVSKPTRPRFVGEIPPPLNADGAPAGVTSRELRVWPQKKLLIVMTFSCSARIHACPAGPPTTAERDALFTYDLRFYDLRDPAHPRFISRWVPTSAAGKPVKPHEMYLWVDPKRPQRALLWFSTPTTSTDPATPNLMIVDISRVTRGSRPAPVAEGNWNDHYPGAENPANYDRNLFVHSMTPTADGKTTYLSMEAGQFMVLDTRQVARGTPKPVIQLSNSTANRPRWGNPLPGCVQACPNGHSSVPVPGRPFALTTDEVYGKYTDPSHGCPWGWMRMVDVQDPVHPQLLSEYKLPQNLGSFCGTAADDPATEGFNSYTAHNPTVLPRLAFVTWHSGGLQAIDIARAADPRQAGFFSPKPLATVATEDPALTDGPNKVAMWSYPIIRNGLIYVVDIRNGLYILRYTGRNRRDVDQISFLEGNSNLGDAVRLSKPAKR